MDTRTKIIGEAEARRLPGPLTVVTGTFDPAWLGEGLPDEGDVLAVVLPHPDELLPLRARAELAAALRAVRWVTPVDSAAQAEALIAALRPARLVRLEEAHARRTLELRARVLDGHA
jgi:hypothetical protein